MSLPPHSRAPDHPPPVPSTPTNLRRSSTHSPARTANASPSSQTRSPGSANSTDGIEILFTSAPTRIVSFTAAVPASSHRQKPDAEPIPWHSITERTLAAGLLRIYRVTSSNVSFLNSGNLLHTIFPKSQCWCVDEESIFVLRVRMDSYYRIELPCETDEDREKAGEFKLVLAQVLQYERTPCPFRRGFEFRGFEVELPQQPERPKTPPQRPPLRRNHPKAKKWMFDTWTPESGVKSSPKWMYDKMWFTENGFKPPAPIPEDPDSFSVDDTTDDMDDDDRFINMGTYRILRSRRPSTSQSDLGMRRASTWRPPSPQSDLGMTPSKSAASPSVRERAMTFQSLEDLSVRNNTPQELRSAPKNKITEFMETDASQESLYSTPLAYATPQGTPTPPFFDAEAELINPWAPGEQPNADPDQRGRSRHRRKISEITLRAQSSEPALPSPRTPTTNVNPFSSSLDANLSSPPSTPPLVSDSDEDSPEPAHLDVRTPPSAIRMRRLTGATQRRAFSPMPHPRNLFRPTMPPPSNQVTAELIRRTCELLLGPPAHLISLMLRIAARISNFGFNTYRLRGLTTRKPPTWESSGDGGVEEDDYGIPLSNLESTVIQKRYFSGEVD